MDPLGQINFGETLPGVPATEEWVLELLNLLSGAASRWVFGQRMPTIAELENMGRDRTIAAYGRYSPYNVALQSPSTGYALVHGDDWFVISRPPTA